MSHGVKLIQDGLKSLGYDAGVSDGLWGDRTAGAMSACLVAKGQPRASVAPAKGLVRIILHWTAGTGAFSDLDREHYHYAIDRDGKAHTGKHSPADNISAADGKYAAHTLGCNTGSIGIAMCGMVGATERPFSAGSSPITAKQYAAFCAFVAGVAVTYGIPVTRTTVLTHAEVEKTLGIAQRGKWDICWVPGMTAPGDPIAVGDNIRAAIIAAKPVAYREV